MNDAGQVVGAYQDSVGLTHGFLYFDNSYTTLDPRGSVATYFQSINENGEIAGSYQMGNGSPEQGFLYSGGVYMLELSAPFL
jgi:probable HAF family extracellular repeat protein